jgi:hypothetical protein
VATVTARRILGEMGLGFTSARASAVLAVLRGVREVDGWRLVEEGRGERVYLRFARKLHCPVCGAEVGNVVSHCLVHVEELCRRGAARLERLGDTWLVVVGGRAVLGLGWEALRAIAELEGGGHGA